MNILCLALALGSLFAQSGLTQNDPAQNDPAQSDVARQNIAGPAAGRAAGPASAVESALASKDWIAKSGDSICGLKEPTQVSNPVVIDWQACLDATPEMKKIKSEKIDASTPEGIKLVNEATNRVTQACETLRTANGYCSVWKSIKHKDGRSITDISDLVKAQF